VKKFEKTAHEIHEMTAKLHNKTSGGDCHGDRARAARERAESSSTEAQKLSAKRHRKVANEPGVCARFFNRILISSNLVR
jgi:hypothetical protein